MKKFNFDYLNNYTNNGQNAEQSIRFKLTGRICKADNTPFTVSTDCLNYQIKSARATICKGDDLDAYFKLDAATAYIYATKTGVAYVMNEEEFKEFVMMFGTTTRDSEKNGGQIKTRLGHETKTMLNWLSAKC